MNRVDHLIGQTIKKNTQHAKREKGRKLFLVVLSLILLSGLLGLSAVTPGVVSAQSNDNAWEKPINLSQSGGATNPIIVPGANGVLYALWQDQYVGLVYRRFNGQDWEPATVGEFPFGVAQREAQRVVLRITLLQLFPGKDGMIHAFWLDGEGHLLYSRVNGDDMAKAVAWTPPLSLAESAIGYDVAIDAQGSLHLAYIRALQSSTIPAGVYYKRSTDNGQNWSQPSFIYQSPYLRDLTSEQTNINIDSAGTNGASWVYISWDNRPRKQIFLSISKNSGVTWGAPLEVDRPSANSGSATPFNLKVSVSGQSALLTWEVGDPGSTCIPFFQLSEDGGINWNEAQPVVENLIGCPQEMRLIHGNDNLTYMMANLQDQIYLLAWNGKRWSTPQPQFTLNSFIDEDTYGTVNLRCRNFTFLPDTGRLLVAGCDSGSGGDVWLTSRPIGNVDDWYPPEPAWMEPSLISNGATSIGTIQSPLIIADPVKGMHVFWSQTDLAVSTSGESGNRLVTTIYYAFWDGEHWLVPGTALATLEGKAIRPAVTLDVSGRLMAVWSTNQTGEIYFSWASASRALSSSEWATPLLLPLPHPVVSSPDILADPAGVIYVAYAIPLNEGRGIYIVSSADLGKTWSTPVKIFDGAVAGWEMIDQPRLAITGDGKLHIMWKKLTVPAGSGVLGLYFASSGDGGKTWSEAKEVIDKPVIWDGIVASGESTLQRFWQESSSGSMMIWHDQSLDGGSTWERPEIVSSFLGTTGLSSLAIDPDGQLHLLQIVEKGPGEFILQHSVWNGATWATFENAELGKDKLDIANDMYAAISPDGKLGVVFAGRKQETESGQPLDLLYFTERKLPVSTGPVQIRPTQPPQPTGTSAPTRTPTPQPTPTLNLANLGPSQTTPGLLPLGNAYAGVILGVILVGTIIALFLGYKAIIGRFRNPKLKP